MAGGDLYCQLQGVPPYLSLEKPLELIQSLWEKK